MQHAVVSGATFTCFATRCHICPPWIAPCDIVEAELFWRTAFGAWLTEANTLANRGELVALVAP